MNKIEKKDKIEKMNTINKIKKIKIKIKIKINKNKNEKTNIFINNLNHLIIRTYIFYDPFIY